MTDALRCYRCGQSLAALSLPLSRRDECPQCGFELQVCRMCEYYDPGLPNACAEDDALEVKEKTRANFCDYFKPSSDAYALAEFDAESAARASFNALFGDESATGAGASSASRDEAALADDAARRAEKLFKQ